jgi:hypothetical protein
MPKEKANYGEVYDLYQLCCATKNLKEFCKEYGVNYEKFMNRQRHKLWNEKLGKTVEVKQPDVAPVNIVGILTVSPTVKSLWDSVKAEYRTFTYLIVINVNNQ